MYTNSLVALLSHWWRKPLQLAMLLLGLSLATAIWSAVQAINGEARASYARAAAMVGQDRLPSLFAADGTYINQAVYVSLRRSGWSVSPVLEGTKRYGDVRLRIIGIDPLTLPAEARQVDIVAGGGGSLREFIAQPGLFYVSAETASALMDEQTPPLRIVKSVPPGVAITDIGQAQVLLGAPGKLSRMILSPQQPLVQVPLATAAPGLVRKEPPAESAMSRLTDSFHLNLTAFGFLAFAVGLFIVHSAVGLAFEQRRSMFRTLRALGLPSRSLVLLLALELLTFAVVAGCVGVAMGYLVAAMLLPDVATSLRGLYGAELEGTLSLRPSVWGAGLIIAILGTFASGLQGLWQAARMPLLAPARPRAWALASERQILVQAIVATLLLVMAGGLLMFGTGLIAGFALLATLLLSGALVLPLLLMLALKAGTWVSRGAVLQWFWSDTRQQLPGLSLALMALLLALAANIGVGSMVSSFRLTFLGWLDQRLASELYVAGRNTAEAETMHDWLVPRSDAVLPIWNTEGEVMGQPVLIYGIVDHATYRAKWPMLEAMPNVWDEVAAGKALLANEQLARRNHLKLGDSVRLPGGHALPVAGIFSDYGNPKGQVIIANDLLVRFYPEASRLRYAVRVAPAKAADLADALRSALNLPEEAVIDQASIKATSLKIFERTFAVTAALNVLTLGVAALAMLASFVTLSGMRVAQLAPLWAMGLTRPHLAGLELLRSLALAAVTVLAAIPLGLGLAWVLLAVVNVEAFGWRLPLYIFPFEWLKLGLLALLVAGLSVLLPAIRLMRLAPADLLRIFADER